MKPLSDAALERLRDVADRPDLTGTRYEIVDRVGRGGMGTVYRARDRELDRDVALKVLHAPAPEAAGRILREARILARLEHPGIVPVHDVGTLPDGRVFYVMKLVRGERLDHHARDDMPLAERLRVFDRIADAVAFAHAKGIVHRDLKPANVMVGAFGEVLVLDWGVAKILDAVAEGAGPGDDAPPGEIADQACDTADTADTRPVTGATRPGTVLGTPGFMAPEQVRGDLARIDRRTDVYGLGGILHALLHGSDPPADPETAPSSGRGVPRALAAIARKARAADPDDRYASVEALKADIGRQVAGEATVAYRENVWERLGRFAGRYRVPIALVLTYLVLRVVFILATRQ